MAKDTANEDDDDKFEKMDDESLNFLEQVRKGKSRNFVLSMKGNKVRSMLIKKKPIKEKDRKAAKGDGFQPVYGVATGSGPNITFAVARSDGFDEKTADRKTEKLKKFLKEQTGKLFKPDFELVDTPPAVAFDDEDLNDPLIARFMKMEPVIAKACDAHPNRVDEIQQTVNEIRELLQDDETRESAGPKIDSFVQFLKDLLSGAATNPPSPPPTPDPSTPPQPTETPVAEAAAQAKKLAEALKKLKPLVDIAINSNKGLKPELHGTMAQIAGEIKSQDFPAATQNIKEFVRRLKSLATERPVTTATDSMDPVDRMQEYSARRDALEPRLLEAQRADRDKATKLGAVWDYANEQTQAGSFDTAFKALDRLEAAIGGVLVTASAPGFESLATAELSDEMLENLVDEEDEQRGVVAFRKAMLFWESTRERVHRDIANLRNAVLKHFPDRMAAADRLEEIIENLDEELGDRIDECINAESVEERAFLCESVLDTIMNYQGRISSGQLSELIDHADANPFVAIAIRSSVENALGRLTDELRSKA